MTVIPIYYYLPVTLLVFILTVAFERKLLPILKRSAHQPIYCEGPAWHMKKSGTPTMGGIAFVLSCVIILSLTTPLLFSVGKKEDAFSLLISLVFCLLNAAIGFIDDMTKLRRKENAGLSPKQKIVLQAFSAILFLVLRGLILSDTPIIDAGIFSISIGILYYPAMLIVILGIINCSNLTDGIDGLASSVTFAIGISFFYYASTRDISSAIIASMIIGLSVGFMLFNLHPAKIFMGDTGSLFLGALTVCCGFSLGKPMMLIPICAVYVLEGISVIIQVVFFKLTSQRIFKMAPLHHHLEKCGMTENKICLIAMVTSFIFAIAAFTVWN